MRIDTTPINYKAKSVAICNNIELFKLTDNADFKALKKLSDNIDFKKLMPKLPESESERWHEMLEYAIFNAQNPGNITYVGCKDNRICGIITYFPGSTTLLDCICTIPNKQGEKVPLAGKSLFLQVFKDFVESRFNRMKLSAITNGPVNTIKKYIELGFSETTNVTKTYVEMMANRYKIQEAVKFLEKIIKYRTVKPRQVDLNNFVN